MINFYRFWSLHGAAVGEFFAASRNEGGCFGQRVTWRDDNRRQKGQGARVFPIDENKTLGKTGWPIILGQRP